MVWPPLATAQNIAAFDQKHLRPGVENQDEGRARSHRIGAQRCGFNQGDFDRLRFAISGEGMANQGGELIKQHSAKGDFGIRHWVKLQSVQLGQQAPI